MLKVCSFAHARRVSFKCGFMRELVQKYKSYANRLAHLIENIYSWLPVASLIDDHIFVTHGGISDITDLTKINKIKRNKVSGVATFVLLDFGAVFLFQYVSILSPIFLIPDYTDQCQVQALDSDLLLEWRQILDLVWSDPKQSNGCEPNTYRGGGCYWGPDVTNEVLEKHRWSLLIRSHECKEEGFDYCHEKKVLTIFSASNYYAVGSNRGAYVKIMTNQPPAIVQFMATKSTVKPLTLWERSVRKERRRRIDDDLSLLQSFARRRTSGEKSLGEIQRE